MEIQWVISMPTIGLLRKTKSFRLRERVDEGGVSPGLNSPRDARKDEAPYEWQRLASPPVSGRTATFHQLLSPNAAVSSHSDGGSPGSYSLTSPTFMTSYEHQAVEVVKGPSRHRKCTFQTGPPPGDCLEKFSSEAKSSDSTSAASECSYVKPAITDSEKPKLTKWKSLGGLFGKKTTATPGAPLYRVQPVSSEESSEQGRLRQFTLGLVEANEDQVARAQRTPVLPSQQWKKASLHYPVAQIKADDGFLDDQSGTIELRYEAKLAVNPTRPVSRRSQTCPVAERPDRSPIPPPKDLNVKPNIAALQLVGGSLLEVEIPSIHLERYSVMFEGLLQRRSASLSTRRQTQAENVRPLEESVERASGEQSDESLAAAYARPSSFLFFESGSRLLEPHILGPTGKPSLGTGFLQRSLTSPTLKSPKKETTKTSPKITPLASSHGFIHVESPSDNEKPVLRVQGIDIEESKGSTASTTASFHSAVEVQSREPSPKPSDQQTSRIHTSTAKRALALRSTRSGQLAAASPSVPASKMDSRGRAAASQEGKQKRNVSVATAQASASVSAEQSSNVSPPSRPRVSKNENITRAPFTAPAAIPTIKTPELLEDGYPLSTSTSIEHRSGSALNILPLASNPPSHGLKGRYESKTTTRLRVSKFSQSANSPTTRPPLSALPAPLVQKTASINRSPDAAPKPTLFSPPPSSSSSDSPPLPSLPESLNDLRSATEISIARQISISRRQRELLAPLAPKYARQPMQPVLVDINAGRPVARESHHLVLEHA